MALATAWEMNDWYTDVKPIAPNAERFFFFFGWRKLSKPLKHVFEYFDSHTTSTSTSIDAINWLFELEHRMGQKPMRFSQK